MPTDRMRFLIHDIGMVHHVLAYSAAPIRLRLCAHGFDRDFAEMVVGLVLLNILFE